MFGALRAEDYDRIEELIHFLGDNFRDQPSLDDIAKQAHLSPHHLQRLFQRWVGISPKQFIQFLTLHYTKQRLKASQSLLNASLDAGLSGPGRLHDLYVKLEAMTPGEYKRSAEGIVLHFGYHNTPFGKAWFAAHERGLCGLFFADNHSVDPDSIIQEYWPRARWIEDQALTQTWRDRVFGDFNKQTPLKLLVHGSAFQIKVWEALLKIPEGQLLSYGEVAKLANCPNATRAVASAIGHNPISYLIPCHRVIRKTGELGGYRWGLPRKKAMLAYEAGRGG